MKHLSGSLPAPYYLMPSVAIAGNCCLLEGVDADNMRVTTVLHASVTPLDQKATSPTRQSPSHTSVWKPSLTSH